MAYLGASLRRRRIWKGSGGRYAVGIALSLAVNLAALKLVDRDWANTRLSIREPRAVSLRPLAPGAWAANRQVAGGARPAPPDRGPLPPPPPPPSGAVDPLALARPKPKPQVPEPSPTRREEMPTRPPAPEPPRTVPPVQETAVAGKQVVDIEATGKKEPPKDARFLGETDNVVEKETISRFARKDFDRTLAQPSQSQATAPVPSPGSSGSDGARADVARLGGGTAQEGTPGPAAPGAPGGSGLRPGAPGNRQLARLDPAARPDPGKDTTATLGGDGVARSFRPLAVPPQGTASPQARGEGGEGGLGGADLLPGEGGGGGTAPRRSGSGPPVLSPSAAFYDKLGGGPFADHVQGVDVGDATVLNTRAWAFAGYMNRVKAAVAYAWDPEPEMHARDPRGDRFFYKERATVLSVTLDDRGGLKEARVLQSSGLDFLDEIAVQAFQKAQPFHNPPAALVPDGTFSFAFTFFIGRAPR